MRYLNAWRRRCLIAATLALVTASTGPRLTVADAVSCRPWRQVPSPQIDGSLQEVSAASASDIWAVGDNGLNPVIEHFDGTRWTLSPSPHVFAYLSGVRSFATDDVWAAGNDGLGRAFAEHWDGAAWSVMNVPQPGDYSYLFALDGPSSSDVWAIGTYQTPYGLKGLAEHYDGTSWATVPMDNVSPLANVMEGVAAIAADDVWAVGYQEISLGENQPLAEHWDGSNWTAVPVAPPPPSNANFFSDVSASSPTDVWAVGTYGDSFALMEHWDGVAWRRYPAPVEHPAVGVVAISPTDAWAGGPGESNPTTWHWNGISWSRAPTPKVGTLSGLAGLVAVSDRDIWAVGNYDPSQGGQTPLIMHSKGACH